jgi:hypothetical protein
MQSSLIESNARLHTPQNVTASDDSLKDPQSLHHHVVIVIVSAIAERQRQAVTSSRVAINKRGGVAQVARATVS